MIDGQPGSTETFDIGKVRSNHLTDAGKPDADVQYVAANGVRPGLAKLIRAGEAKKTEIRRVNIRRDGEVILSFRIRVVEAPEVRRLTRECTRFFEPDEDPTDSGGGRMLDEPLYRLKMIDLATVEEDRRDLWAAPDAQQHYDVFEPHEVIEKVLKIGEVNGIFQEIAFLSGFNQSYAEQIDKAKNL